LELPVVPGAREGLTLDLPLKEGITLVGTPVVHGIDGPLGAKEGNALVIVPEQPPATYRQVIDCGGWHPIIVRGGHAATVQAQVNLKSRSYTG
jgi:hypothetical protein